MSLLFRKITKFQSTLPRRERPAIVLKKYKVREFQSTLPRRERLGIVTYMLFWSIISIHAPAKGATPPAVFNLVQIFDFNPRSREGSD